MATGIGAAALVFFAVEPVATMLVPFVIALLPVFAVGRKSTHDLLLASAILMALVSFLGGFSVGLLFVPSTICFVVATDRANRPGAPATRSHL